LIAPPAPGGYHIGRMKKRAASLSRQTRETKISVSIDLDGDGTGSIRTGIPFLNHMLELMAKHSLIDIRIAARGDLDVDYHHTVEDVGLALGEALNRALGDRRGISRYGWSLLPMDEALCRVALDLGGRPYLVYALATRRRKIRDFDVGLVEEFFRAFSVQARMNLHIHQIYGQEPHHACESVFKGVARALRMACQRDPRVRGVPSSKGRL
jgi:imidazoleglycerol-phosphate dehydratase